jgi:hypothetical protein
MKGVDSYQKSKRDMARERGVVCGERTIGGWWVVVVRDGYGEAHCLAVVKGSSTVSHKDTDLVSFQSELALGDCLLKW